MPAAPRAPHDLADAVFRVGRAYGMTADRSIYQAVAVKDGRITAAGRSRDELDSFIGRGPTQSRRGTRSVRWSNCESW
jgi:predicted amidohydrolase YtcJ